MSEAPPDLNAETRRDPDLAQHVAYAEDPLRVGVERAEELGELATANTLQAVQDNAGLKARNAYVESQAQGTVPSQAPEIEPSQGAGATESGQEAEARDTDKGKPEDSEITDEDREKIKHWLTDGLSTVHTWIGRNDIDKKRHNPDGQNKFLTLFSEHSRARRVIGEIPKGMMPMEHQRIFHKQGIAETLTVHDLDTSFSDSDINQDSPNGQEDTTVISYETGFSPVKRDGAYLNMQLFLPASKAAEVLNAIKADPNLAREMVEVFMDDVIGADENGWSEGNHPQYDKMMDSNGGVNRMAIRSERNIGPKRSQVIEY